jgi:hypothetical protein
MRKTLTAMAFAAGLIGLGAAAQAAPVPASSSLPGLAGEIATPVQMSPRERRMIRHHRMDRRMHHRRMERRMMRREMRRDMRRRGY